MRVAAICLLSWAAAVAFAGTMYKWVDAKGVTHFSEDPPPDGKAQRIDVKPVPPSSPAAAPRADDWRDREFDLRQRRVQKERAEEAARRDAAERHARCLRARRDLDVLRKERPVYTVNERGERIYLDDRQRASEIEAATRLAESACS